MSTHVITLVLILYILQIVIEGEVGGGVHNDIAIDDISLTPGCEVGGILVSITYNRLFRVFLVTEFTCNTFYWIFSVTELTVITGKRTCRL